MDRPAQVKNEGREQQGEGEEEGESQDNRDPPDDPDRPFERAVPGKDAVQEFEQEIPESHGPTPLPMIPPLACPFQKKVRFSGLLKSGEKNPSTPGDESPVRTSFRAILESSGGLAAAAY